MRAMTPKTTVTQAHFSIDGEWLTDTARSLYAHEDAPEKAIRLLVTGLIGMTEEQALSILEGRFKLVGSSDDEGGVSMVPDKPKEKLPSAAEVIKKLKEERDEARDDLADMTEIASGDTIGLGSPTGMRVVARRKTQSLPYGGGRTLKDGLEWHDAGELVKKPGAKPVRVYVEASDPEVAVKQRRRMARHAAAKLDPEKAADLDKELRQYRPSRPPPVPERPSPPPPPADSITGPHGWLSPEGKFYACGYAGHRGLAEKILGRYDYESDGKGGEQTFEELGWVRFTTMGATQLIHGFLHECKARPTDVQKRLVTDFCLEGGHDLPHWAQEE
jgi:hypothetical protein